MSPVWTYGASLSAFPEDLPAENQPTDAVLDPLTGDLLFYEDEVGHPIAAPADNRLSVEPDPYPDTMTETPPPSPPSIQWSKFLNANVIPTTTKWTLSIKSSIGVDKFAERLLIPASVTKLLTSVYALSTLGQNFQFKTNVRFIRDAKDPTLAHAVTLLGEGDPTLGHNDFDPAWNTRFNFLAERLKAAGISKVKGGVKAKSLFSTVSSHDFWSAMPQYSPHWHPRHRSKCFAAGAAAFNIHENCLVLHIRSPSKYGWAQAGVPYRIISKIKLTTGSTAIRVSVNYETMTVVLSGIMSKTKKVASSQLLMIQKTERWAAEAMRDSLERVGVTFLAPGQSTATPPANAPFEEVESHSLPLVLILRRMNRDSINIFAEALYLRAYQSRITAVSQISLLGAKADREKFFRDIVGIEKPMKIFDGSGLSEKNLISANQMVSILEWAKSQNWFEVFRDSLAVSGSKDGTLKNRFLGPKTLGRVFAKTGTINGTSALAGYLHAQDGELKSFTMIGNGLGWKAKSSINEVISYWAAFENKDVTNLLRPSPFRSDAFPVDPGAMPDETLPRPIADSSGIDTLMIAPLTNIAPPTLAPNISLKPPVVVPAKKPGAVPPKTAPPKKKSDASPVKKRSATAARPRTPTAKKKPTPAKKPAPKAKPKK